MIHEKRVVLVLVHDDRIDLLVGERWPAGHADFLPIVAPMQTTQTACAGSISLCW